MVEFKPYYDENRLLHETDRRFHAADAERAGRTILTVPAVVRNMAPLVTPGAWGRNEQLLQQREAEARNEASYWDAERAAWQRWWNRQWRKEHHTTDVYRGKLRLYEAWGFPEVWVEVPNYRAASRPKRRRAGLTIHVLEGGGYRESAESRAFPGWSAEEVHVSFNERVRSAGTCAVLERVGRVLGKREGTGPDDDPMLRSLRVRSREEGEVVGKVLGRMEGLVEGERKGRVEGRAEGRAGMVRAILSSRGIGFSEDFPAGVPGLTESPEAVIVAAALACDGERDFRARIVRAPGG